MPATSNFGKIIIVFLKRFLKSLVSLKHSPRNNLCSTRRKTWTSSILQQLFLVLLLFPIIHFTILIIRGVTPRIGHDELLFPSELLTDEPRLNEHRTRVAEKVMESLKKPMKNPVSASVDIRVIASNRGFGVLFQTVIFLLEQQQQHRNSPDFNFSVSICNVESDIFPDLQRFSELEIPVTTFGRNFEVEPEEKLNSTIRKENEDYWKCLGLPTESRYILLMEDDVIVLPEFSTLLKSMIRKLDFSENVDYVKLYHPKYLRKIPFYFLIAIPTVSSSFFLCYFVKIVSGNFQILTFLILSIVIFWDLKSFGSQFPSEIRYHLTGSAYFSVPESCCTQAVIFRQSSVSEMLEIFNNSVAFSGYAKDHILDESSQFTGRQSDINYVAHIGSFSSVRQKAVSLSDDWREI
ncbi:hypothetical protein CAEBREN_14191 [Caenorhabditis brenneri]|uniref:Uncharacterized protein n=1 Tax=Caenorhabditis brenneri TaxID=135651 RepID=G0NFJ5_CAEBE|nr:hypothetical protein CAEBREN_14191 [Caenorhabditis brenneri]